MHRGLLCKIISTIESSIFLKWRLFKLSNISISLQSRIEKSASCRGFYIFKNFTVFYNERNKIRVIRVYLIRTAYFVLIHPCVKEGFNERQYQFPSFSINSARLHHSYRNFSYELGELFYVQLVNRLMPPFERERAPLYNKIHINRAPYVGWVWSHQTCSRFASAVQFMLANLS